MEADHKRSLHVHRVEWLSCHKRDAKGAGGDLLLQRVTAIFMSKAYYILIKAPREFC